MALWIDDKTISVRAESTGPRIHPRAIVGQREESFAADRQIQVVVREFDIALRKTLLDIGEANTRTGRCRCQALRCERIDVGKITAAMLCAVMLRSAEAALIPESAIRKVMMYSLKI